VLSIFQTGSHGLFSWAGLEPQSSWSLLPEVEITGMSHWHPALPSLKCSLVYIYFPNMWTLCSHSPHSKWHTKVLNSKSSSLTVAHLVYWHPNFSWATCLLLS
jgi:hypothetical protein